MRGHAAAAFRFKGARQNVEPVRAAREALQVEIQFGVAFVVGDGGRESFVIRLFDHFADLEAIVGVLLEARQHGGKIEFAFHAAIAGGLAEQMHDRDAGLHIGGGEPAGQRACSDRSSRTFIRSGSNSCTLKDTLPSISRCFSSFGSQATA